MVSFLLNIASFSIDDGDASEKKHFKNEIACFQTLTRLL